MITAAAFVGAVVVVVVVVVVADRLKSSELNVDEIQVTRGVRYKQESPIAEEPSFSCCVTQSPAHC